MSGRAILAIGCNSYDNFDPLGGAEADATSLFQLLVEPQIGDYDVDRSCLLLSPTLQDAREALAGMLFDGDSLDTLTVAFAGHGAVSSGSFYMAMRDARTGALSATALSLADLFRMLAEAAPRQTYVIIDACQSGGLISDLNVILKSELMGEVGTPGVTLLATAASNEAAFETDGDGIGTAALLDCIRGDMFLQDSNPALDLIEIARAISERITAAGGQSPVVWGLNLYGPAGFCKNPHAGTGNAPLRSVLTGWPDAKTSAAIRAGLHRLWEPYVATPSLWEARRFLDRLTPLLHELEEDPEVKVIFLRRVADAFAAQAWSSRDRFREIEIRSSCAVALLPFSGNPQVAAYLAETSVEIARLVERVITEAAAAIESYEFALVTGGLGDLYYLPIRISKLLGWAGFAVHARLAGGEDAGPAATCLAELFHRIFHTYSLSLVAMSDSQAPYIMSVLTAAGRVGLSEDAERLVGYLFSSSVACGGRVARADLDPSKVLTYLLARVKQPVEPSVEMVAQPTELVLTLLRASRMLNLIEEIDTALEQLDHLALNAYLPDGFEDFGSEQIGGGTNAVFQIGQDVWSVADLEAAWPDRPLPPDAGTAMTALLASLLFPDRTAWFLLQSLVEEAAMD